MLKVKFNTQNENPFYGMSNSLKVFQDASKGNVSITSVTQAWNECDDDNKKAMLLSLLFSVGDVTGRHHNLFKKRKVDSGGNSYREPFRDTLIPFLVSKQKDVLGLMKLISEYTTMDNIFAQRVVTKKKTQTVQRIINMPAVYGVDNVAQFAYEIVTKGSDFQKHCLSKFLVRPVYTSRQGSKKLLPKTKEVMAGREDLLKIISKKVGWAYEKGPNGLIFTGYYAWRKPYVMKLESFLFSSGSILNFDEEEFYAILNQLPSDARFRVKTRVLYNEKWSKLKGWYKNWETFKEKAQKEQREIETRVKEGVASDDDKEKLKEVKKLAKVTTGAVNFEKLYTDIVNGRVDKLKIQPFLDAINLPYNTLTFIDDSGSMKTLRGEGFTARQFGAFIATICLMKNPDADASNVIGLFSASCRMYNGISNVKVAPNSLLVGKTKDIGRQALINSNDHFLTNLSRMSMWLDSESTWNGTNITSVFMTLSRMVENDDNIREELMKYPVWTFISDGNFNNLGSAEASVNDFLKRCETKLGFKPYLILIDVAGKSSADITRFSGIDNLMMVPPNPASIEMFLTRFRDMDVYDIYTPLQSIYRTDRYEPVRHYVYGKNPIEVLESVSS